VTCDGKPVANAVLIFSPVPSSETALESGKAASGSTDADGRYTLTTYKRGDGALIGKHRASIMPDETGSVKCKPKVVVLEVQPGKNELDIVLSK